MSKVIVRSRQTVYDISIQEFGTLENLREVIFNNELPFDITLAQGDELEVEKVGVGNEDVKDFYRINGIFPQNNWDETNFLTCDNDVITCDNDIITCDQTIE